MTSQEPADLLRARHGAAPTRDKALHMSLFAIEYEEQLESHDMAEVAELAWIGKSGPQLSLGRKLAKHVDLK